MNKAEALKNGLLGLAALAMVGALVFLYDKTQAVDLRERNEILGFLRELKEIDGRWDVDVLRARLESGANELPVINRTPGAVKALQQLNSALQTTPSTTLSAWLPELSKTILQKADLVEKFKAENAGTKAGLDALLRQSAELGEQSAQLKPRQPAADAALNRLAAAAPAYYWLAQDAQRRNLEAALADLQSAAPALPEALRAKAEQARSAGEALLKHRAAEQTLANKLEFLTSGPRLDTLTFSFNRELEAMLQDKERFRVYLIYYAGALLILLAYLGFELKAANLSHERRVEESTR